MPAIPPAQGGTGQSTYTDGQLLIGDSSTNGLDKGTLGASGGATITNGHGTITVNAAGPGLSAPNPGNSGGVPYYNTTTTLASSATLAANALVTGGGAGGAPATQSDWTIQSGQQLEANFNAAAIPSAITGSAGATFTIQQVDTTINTVIQVSYGAGCNNISWRAEGTGASPTATGANQPITALGARGFDGTNWVTTTMGNVVIRTQNQTSPTDHSTRVDISATPKGSTTVGAVALFQAASDGGQLLLGNTSAGRASAGNVGEYISSIVLDGAAVVLTTATTANVTSITLTAGDWDVWGEVWFDTSTGGASLPTLVQGAISQTTATLPAVPADGTARTSLNFTATSSSTGLPILPIASCSILTTASLTVFLVARATFTAGACSAYGKICARRRQ